MSYIAATLPANAPFSSLQRAWLDGFLAGLFGDEAGAAETLPPGAIAAAAERPEPAADAVDDSRARPNEAEDFPWHDPVLTLDERQALAAGRPLAQMLMAATAQLDCGQCGYLCREYAEAIARGDEKQLSRCAPGGKATSRAIRDVLADFAAVTMPMPAAAPAAAAPPAVRAVAAPPSPSPEVAAMPAQMVAAHRLHAAGAEKDTRHIVLAAGDAGLAYEVGDSLGVIASNAPELVAAIIERLRAKPDTPVLSPDGVERPLAEALARFCEIRRPSDQAIEVLSSRALDIEESRILQAMAEGYPGAGPEDADLLDLLETFPSARPPLSELISALDPLQPRLYSIASSPKEVEGEVHLAVAAVRYQKRARRRLGVASTFLCDRASPGETVPVFVRPSEGFRLPPPDRPIVMIGPGTGIAPFRAFLQERQALGATGRNWLFFGNPHRASDFLFEEELAAWHRTGLLTRLDTAFSRDQEHKVYVQHRMLEHAAELWAWLEDGAHVYVCGDAERMARDIDRGLAYIIAKEGGREPAAAKAYLARLAAEGRYQRDVY